MILTGNTRRNRWNFWLRYQVILSNSICCINLWPCASMAFNNSPSFVTFTTSSTPCSEIHLYKLVGVRGLLYLKLSFCLRFIFITPYAPHKVLLSLYNWLYVLLFFVYIFFKFLLLFSKFFHGILRIILSNCFTVASSLHLCVTPF